MEYIPDRLGSVLFIALVIGMTAYLAAGRDIVDFVLAALSGGATVFVIDLIRGRFRAPPRP